MPVPTAGDSSNVTIAVLSVVATALGGCAVKLVDKYYRMKEKTIDFGTSLRGELHTRMKELEEQVGVKQRELDEWKGKYYALLEINMEMKARAASDRVASDRVTNDQRAAGAVVLASIAVASADKSRGNGERVNAVNSSMTDSVDAKMI